MRGWVSTRVSDFIDGLSDSAFPQAARDSMKRTFQAVRDGTVVLDALSESDLTARAQWIEEARRTDRVKGINEDDVQLLWHTMHATSLAMQRAGTR